MAAAPDPQLTAHLLSALARGMTICDPPDTQFIWQAKTEDSNTAWSQLPARQPHHQDPPLGQISVLDNRLFGLLAS
jgi:hypothetical protein